MKLIVIARAKNEEKNIEKFIRSYDWVDKIIIVDGGSEDDTPKIAKELGAGVSFFFDEVEQNGAFRNPHGKHWNFAIKLAEFYKADWIIHDDVDSVPNKHLQEHGRQLIEGCERDFIYATRVYMYKDLGYASKMSITNEEWQQGLWAWKANQNFYFSEDDPFVHTFTEPSEVDIWRIKPPTALLHSPWPDDETIQAKLDFYGKIYNRQTKHPLEYCGAIKQLDWWMTDD